MFARIRIATLCQEGLYQGEFPDVSEWTKAMLFRHGWGTEIQELSMTCITQATQRLLLLQLMTATYGFQFRGTLKATLPCWIMLFVQPQDVMFWLKLYEIGCMMRNFTPNVHGEIHIWHLNTMQCSTDGPNNTLNGLVKIGIKFYSQVSVAYAFNQTIVGDVFGGSLVRLSTLTHCPASAARWWFPDVLVWHYVGPTYATGGHGSRSNGYTIQEWYPPTYSATISAELWRGIRLNGRQFSPSCAHLVNEFLHDNNIDRLESPACSIFYQTCLGYIQRTVFGRDDPPTTLRDLRRIAIEECDNLDQQDLDELVDRMSQQIQACITARGHATGY